MAKMKQATWAEIKAGIKISRLDVAKILAEAAIACRNPASLEKLYRRLGK